MDDTTPPLDRLAYRPGDAAIALGITRWMVDQLIARGEIISRKCGRATLIPRAELDRFIEGLPLSAPSLAATERAEASRPPTPGS